MARSGCLVTKSVPELSESGQCCWQLCLYGSPPRKLGAGRQLPPPGLTLQTRNLSVSPTHTHHTERKKRSGDEGVNRAVGWGSVWGLLPRLEGLAGCGVVCDGWEDGAAAGDAVAGDAGPPAMTGGPRQRREPSVVVLPQTEPNHDSHDEHQERPAPESVDLAHERGRIEGTHSPATPLQSPNSFSPTAVPGEKQKRGTSEAQRIAIIWKPRDKQNPGPASAEGRVRCGAPGTLCRYVTLKHCKLNNAKGAHCPDVHMERGELVAALEDSHSVNVLASNALNSHHEDYSQEKADLWAEAKRSSNKFEYVADRSIAWFEELRQAAYNDLCSGRRRMSVDECPSSPWRETRSHLLDVPLDEHLQSSMDKSSMRASLDHGSKLDSIHKVCYFVERSTCNRCNQFVARTQTACGFAHMSYEHMRKALLKSHSVTVCIAQTMNPSSPKYSEQISSIWRDAKNSGDKWEYAMLSMDRFFIKLRQMAYEDWCAHQLDEERVGRVLLLEDGMQAGESKEVRPPASEGGIVAVPQPEISVSMAGNMDNSGSQETLLCNHVSNKACVQLNNGEPCSKAHMPEADLIDAMRSSQSVSNFIHDTVANPSHPHYNTRRAILWKNAKESGNEWKHAICDPHPFFAEIRQKAFEDCRAGHKPDDDEEEPPSRTMEQVVQRTLQLKDAGFDDMWSTLLELPKLKDILDLGLKNVCPLYNGTSDSCPYGGDCEFFHDLILRHIADEEGFPWYFPNQPCPRFRNGQCADGDLCRLPHVPCDQEICQCCKRSLFGNCKNWHSSRQIQWFEYNRLVKVRAGEIDAGLHFIMTHSEQSGKAAGSSRSRHVTVEYPTEQLQQVDTEEFLERTLQTTSELHRRDPSDETVTPLLDSVSQQSQGSMRQAVSVLSKGHFSDAILDYDEPYQPVSDSSMSASPYAHPFTNQRHRELTDQTPTMAEAICNAPPPGYIGVSPDGTAPAPERTSYSHPFAKGAFKIDVPCFLDQDEDPVKDNPMTSLTHRTVKASFVSPRSQRDPPHSVVLGSSSVAFSAAAHENECHSTPFKFPGPLATSHPGDADCLQPMKHRQPSGHRQQEMAAVQGVTQGNDFIARQQERMERNERGANKRVRHTDEVILGPGFQQQGRPLSREQPLERNTGRDEGCRGIISQASPKRTCPSSHAPVSPTRLPEPTGSKAADYQQEEITVADGRRKMRSEEDLRGGSVENGPRRGELNRHRVRQDSCSPVKRSSLDGGLARLLREECFDGTWPELKKVPDVEQVIAQGCKGFCHRYNGIAESCKFGSKCFYYHDPILTRIADKECFSRWKYPSTPCRYWTSSRGCSRGNACHYSHVPAGMKQCTTCTLVKDPKCTDWHPHLQILWMEYNKLTNRRAYLLTGGVMDHIRGRSNRDPPLSNASTSPRKERGRSYAPNANVNDRSDTRHDRHSFPGQRHMEFREGNRDEHEQRDGQHWKSPRYDFVRERIDDKKPEREEKADKSQHESRHHREEHRFQPQRSDRHRHESQQSQTLMEMDAGQREARQQNLKRRRHHEETTGDRYRSQASQGAAMRDLSWVAFGDEVAAKQNGYRETRP